MHTFLLKLLFPAVIVASLTGCANPGSERRAAGASPEAKQAKAPVDLAPGEQVDYAGHRCGNPNLYVKTHLCLYPRR
ncbi:hypothetical protein [Paraburkholderia fungorum]|uniref:Lipoprotein n=1 Tax=Paraburkholderia fungorum TaxID=134537 RepID=A0A420GY79_9BURK|nr:hypothetical protein [Paraburkholderia fungorum]RKF50167.1 hypothetical protein BCY88_15545 [Paraburkholderia fungorum]